MSEVGCLHGLAEKESFYFSKHPDPTHEILPRIVEIDNECENTLDIRSKIIKESLSNFLKKDTEFIKIINQREKCELQDFNRYLKISFEKCFSKLKWAEIEAKMQVKGILCVKVDNVLSYPEANQLATEKYGGLCTKEELMDAGLCVFDFTFFQYVRREDLKKDMISLGPIFLTNLDAGRSIIDDPIYGTLIGCDFFDQNSINWFKSREGCLEM